MRTVAPCLWKVLDASAKGGVVSGKACARTDSLVCVYVHDCVLVER